MHAYIGGMSGVLIIIRKVGNARMGDSDLVRRPQPFRILLFYVHMLATDNTKLLFNFSIYRTLLEKNVWVNYSYNVDMIEFANMTISKQQIALIASVPRLCNGSALA